MDNIDKALWEANNNPNIKIASSNYETPEEKKARLLAELEQLRQEEQLTEKQKEEAERLARIEVEKTEIYNFFKSRFDGTSIQNSDLSVEKFTDALRQTVSDEIAKALTVNTNTAATPLVQETDTTSAKHRISTPNALKSLYTLIAVGFAVFVGLMFSLSDQGSTSSSMQNMFNAFPLRFLINVLLVSSSLGIAFCYCYFFHPEVWGYFHSKIKTQCTPQKDWNASPPQFRLQFVSDLFWKWALLFVLAFLVIFV